MSLKNKCEVSYVEKEIVDRLKTLRLQEDDIVRVSIELLSQVDEQKIFLKLGYPSLYEFCLQELGYSEGSAYKRIAATRLFKDLPEIKEKAVAGHYSLSTLAQVHTFIKKKERDQQPLARSEKIELVHRVENMSTRDCEREILKIDPKAHKPDRAIQVTHDLTEMRLTVDAEFMASLNRLRERLSIRGIYENKDVIFHALKSELIRIEKTPKEVSVITQLSKNNLLHQGDGHRIVIPRSLRALVHAKSAGECAYIDPQTKRKCSGRNFLEIDHIVPISRGGTNNLNNLQLMCSAHNRLKGASLLESDQFQQQISAQGSALSP